MPPGEVTSESDIDSIKAYHENMKNGCKRAVEEDPTSESDIESILQYHKEVRKKLRLEPQTNHTYTCDIGDCKESFKRKDQLDRHVFKHNGIKKYPCTVTGCEKAYAIITHLKRHVRTFHEGYRKPKMYNCPLCPKKFESEFSVERHVKNVHENFKQYACNMCDEKFKRKIKLRKHEVEVHKKSYPYSCDKCFKGFVEECFFKRHKCKTYACEVCAETFPKWSALLAHKQQEGHKVKCHECGEMFEHKGLLNIHKEQKHKPPEEREVFPCTFEGCTKFYMQKRNLNHHIRSAHEGKKFKCPEDGCGRELVTKTKLEQHMKVIHGERKAAEPKVPKGKAKRKDAGQKKNVMLLQLSGVICEDKKLRQAIKEREIPLELNEDALMDEVLLSDECGHDENLVQLTID